MTWLRVLRARFFALSHKAQLESEMEEVVRFHLAMRAQENMRRGMSPAEASLKAKRQFGNINLVKDAWRDVTGGGLFEAVWQDVRFAGRMLLKDRAFALTAVLALGLGIGANTALFTVVSKVLLRPLPYPRPGDLMSISLLEDGKRDHLFPFSYPDFAELRAQNQWFSGLGAFCSSSFIVGGGEGETIHAEGARVTPDILRLLGVELKLGRLFTDAESEPGNRSVLISHQLWQERFRGAAAVVGAELVLDGYPHKVIGVMPPGFEFPVTNDPAQVWTTFARDREASPSGMPGITTHRDAHYLHLLGRLKDNISRQTAANGMNGVVASLAAKYPETNRRLDSCAVVPWLVHITDKVRPALLMLVGAALCVLSIAFVNVANLLLARPTTREKEMAIRAALGAGRARIVRQLLTESLLLATIGGCLGVVLALVGTHYIVAMLPPDFPRSREIAPDMQMLVFTGIVSVITSCFFGFAPAWHSARCELARVLNDCGRMSGERPHGRQIRGALVMTELVLAFVLLASAASLIDRLWRLERIPPGFNPHNLATASVSVPESTEVDGPLRTAAFYRELLARLAAVKEIKSAGAVYPLPLTSHSVADFEVIGRPMPKADLPRAFAHSVTLNYFHTMQIPLLEGRDFDARDRRDAPPVVIVNETLARKFFPKEKALGKRIRPGLIDGSGPPPEREIIGIVGDVNGDDPSDPMPAVYLPHPQCVAEEMTLVLRGDGSARSLFAAARRVVSGLDQNVAFYETYPMEHYLAATVAQERLNSILMGIFATVAITLTAIGVYGVMAYSVAQRRHEIGIRLALGAQKRAVFRLILGQGVRLLGWSLLAGGLCTLMVTRFLRATAHMGSDNNAVTTASVAILLSAVALVACWLPARRAAGVDPLTALGQR
jgi:putative ABC transport system permease protein